MGNTDDWAAQEEAFFGTLNDGSGNDDRKMAAAVPRRAVGQVCATLGREIRDPTTSLAPTRAHLSPDGPVVPPPTAGTTAASVTRSYGVDGRNAGIRDPHRHVPTESMARRTNDSSQPTAASAAPPPTGSLSSFVRRVGDSTGARIGSAISHLASRIPPQLSNHAPGCVVCGAPSPSRYRYQPFFPEERACASHSAQELRPCCFACRRFSPLPGHTRRDPFADLDEHGRKICGACLRTVVTDSEQGAQLWYAALRYLRTELGLFDLLAAGGGGKGVRERMEAIPVLVVDMDALNDPSVRGSGHGGGGDDGDGDGSAEGTHTRGLCLYEYKYDPMGGQLREFLRGVQCDSTAAAVLNALGGNVASAVAAASNPTTDSHVTAVLCLRGLPRDLAASVLAHEATHAWFKLHPEYDATRGLPKMVEEGCCQLVAFQYLSYLDDFTDESSDGTGWEDEDCNGQPTDQRLRQYFRYCIESMVDDIYGEGFRRAAAAHALLGSVRAVLEYVIENNDFPAA